MQINGYFLNIMARIMWGWSAMYIAKSPAISLSQVYLNRVLWATIALITIRAFLCRKVDWIIVAFSIENLFKIFPGAILIGINWLTVIQCIRSGDIITAAVGFYIAPIISIILGYVLFKEHDGIKSIIALMLCVVGVALILGEHNNHFNVGYVLIISLSSAIYAAIRKGNTLGAFETNIIEGIIILIISSLYVWIKVNTEFQINLSEYDYYFPILGLMTSVPMVLYISSLRLIKVNVAGYFQYITPSVMLFFGLFFLNNTVTHQMWLGFMLLWFAILTNLIPSKLLILRRSHATPKHNSK